MPSLTYNNLTDAKKQQILQIAFKEFTLHTYEKASVSNIIKQLGIAKGSFYRYFRNKLDLYTYLVEYATAVRLEKVEHHPPETKAQDFFAFLEDNFVRRIKFEQQYPIYGQFLYNIMRERHSELLGNIMLKTKRNLVQAELNLDDQKGNRW
ncbi:MAG: TetR/AcrR family transcriptional regulator [Bacteroidota bacterium]